MTEAKEKIGAEEERIRNAHGGRRQGGKGDNWEALRENTGATEEEMAGVLEIVMGMKVEEYGEGDI